MIKITDNERNCSGVWAPKGWAFTSCDEYPRDFVALEREENLSGLLTENDIKMIISKEVKMGRNKSRWLVLPLYQDQQRHEWNLGRNAIDRSEKKDAVREMRCLAEYKDGIDAVGRERPLETDILSIAKELDEKLSECRKKTGI